MPDQNQPETITLTRDEIVAAYRLWRADEKAGICEPIEDDETHTQRSADAFLDFVEKARAAAAQE